MLTTSELARFLRLKRRTIIQYHYQKIITPEQLKPLLWDLEKVRHQLNEYRRNVILARKRARELKKIESA